MLHNAPLVQSKYSMQSNILSLDGGSGEEAASDLNIYIFEDVETDSFKNMFEIANMSQMLNVK